MKISTSIYGVIKAYGMEDGLKMLADAGFEAVDYSMAQRAMCIHHDMNWDEGFLLSPTHPEFGEFFRNIGKTVRSCGLEMFQCHAPYAPVTISDADYYANLQQQTLRSIYAAGYLECPNIVAHPVLDIDFCNGKNKERARQTNLDYYSAFASALRQTGVTMCIENVFYVADRRMIPNFCSSAEELRDTVDTLNEMHGPHYAVCLDTGHAVLTKDDPAQMVKTLGDRLRVLHVQDNHGTDDEHLIPTRGTIKWKQFATALGQIGYRGTINFESDAYFISFGKNTYSRDTFLQGCKLLYHIGRSLADHAEGTFSAL